MAIIAKYTFNSRIDTSPTFNDGFTYTYTNVDNGDGTITRTITSDSSPTSISFKDNKYGLISVNYLDTSNVTDMSYMFYNCKVLITIEGLNTWNTSKVTDMSYMFSYSEKLATLDLSNWDTSNVTEMTEMFSGCTNLTSLDISNFNTNKVTSMGNMFYNCRSLTTLDISSFNTSKLTSRQNMFYDCSNLNLVDMVNSDTDSINDIIATLPTRAADSMGTLLISDLDPSINKSFANSKYWNIVKPTEYSFTMSTLKYFLTKLKEKFVLKSELDSKVDRIILQEEVPERFWIKEQLKYGNNEYFIEVPYFNSFDCIKIEIDSKIYDKNDFVELDSEYDNLGSLKVGDLEIEIGNDSYHNFSIWRFYIYAEEPVEGKPINSAYVIIESQYKPGIEKMLVSNDYTDEYKDLNGNLINDISVDKTDTEYTLVFNNKNDIETTVSIPYDKYKKSALFVDCDEEFYCENESKTTIPLRYITSIKEYGSTMIIEKIRNDEIIEERFEERKGDTVTVPFPLDTEVELSTTSLKNIVSLCGKSLEEEILDNYGRVNYENNTAECTFGTVHPFSIKPNSNGNLVFFFKGLKFLNGEGGNYKAGDYYMPEYYYLTYIEDKGPIKSYTYIPHIDDTELRIYAIDPEGTKTGTTYLKPFIIPAGGGTVNIKD